MGESDSESESKSPPRNDAQDEKKPKDKGDGKAIKKPGSKEKGRKRTKTGCLTCRRRRIKCGEERPTCQNCTKSKRLCEGYNQRVVFKDPHTTYRGPPIPSSVPFMETTPTFRQEGPPSNQQISMGPTPIAPKPHGSFGINIITQNSVPPSLPPVATPGVERIDGYSLNSASTHPMSASSGPPPTPLERFDSTGDTVDASHVPDPIRDPQPSSNSRHYNFEDFKSVQEESSLDQSRTARTNSLDWTSNQNLSGYYHSFPPNSNWAQVPMSSASAGTNSAITPSHANALPPWNNPVFRNDPVIQRPDQHVPYHDQPRHLNRDLSDDRGAENQARISITQENSHEDDNDPFDVSEDEDVDMGEYDGDGEAEDKDLEAHLNNNDLGVVVALQARQDTARLRSFTSFIDRPDMLSQYVPSSRSSPLKDPMTARVFCHFVNVTGPAISMFERHPANPSLIFRGEPVPKSQQHIWTYTFPTLALQNPGLLHAMCALASLHIAKLQNKAITPSLKHYAYGLRRVAKSVSSPSRRGLPATLAAAMLLAFYEVWCADHQKWTNHLLGARMLVREIDFVGMTKYIKTLKRRQRQEDEHARMYQAQQQGRVFHYDGHYPGTEDDVNENIVAILMGKQLRYDQFGQIITEEDSDTHGSKSYTKRELEIYEIQRDLFWWYCKQDVYQSILGGGKLFMEYELWSHCPPRAPLGRLNATYGTYDHLVLLMGRLANFSAKDLKRKQMVMRANGGYRPPEGSASPPEQGESQRPNFPQMPPPAAPQMPPFTGMFPVTDAKLPMGFGPNRASSPQSNHSDEVDLETLTMQAEEEWQDIRHAFGVLENHFGDDFQALGPEFVAPIETPFGPALQYRTYGIAGIWMNLYTALIVCHRAHPSMPPAAMAAAGLAARHTSDFANAIGRIAGGIAPDCGQTAEVNPGVGAALIECGIPLFVAGVQYQNPVQRNWLVEKLRDMSRLTGWETALAIVTGCEAVWTKTGEMRQGPPYVRQSDETRIPSWGQTSRRFDRALSGSNGEGKLKISSSDRAHFALGLLSINEDFEHLELVDENKPTVWMPNESA
ncbi:hypothetical protein B0O99DRAFT_596726 [Bisporella sp. PMI_857]|nr:hypothetical protein B0O99DRAFT_596726 [Bisporella sp. PMI_857]